MHVYICQANGLDDLLGRLSLSVCSCPDSFHTFCLSLLLKDFLPRCLLFRNLMMFYDWHECVTSVLGTTKYSCIVLTGHLVQCAKNILQVDKRSVTKYNTFSAELNLLRTYFWHSLCTLYLLTRWVRVTVSDLGLCCCVCVTKRNTFSAELNLLRTYLWHSLCTLYLLIPWVRVTVSDLGLCCCVYVTKRNTFSAELN